jgi:hypothetical protein
MAITRIQAQKLCNTAEMELVGQSLGDALKGLTAAQLRGKVQRARTLRSKFADLFQRQTAAIKAGTGSQRGNSGEANARTGLKLQLFDEVLKRFETRLAQLDAQAARAAAAVAKAQAKAQAAAAKAAKTAAKAPVKAPTKAAAKTPAKKAPKVSVRAAVKAAAKAPVKRPAAKKLAQPAKKVAAPKVPAAQRATQVSKVVAVRGKQIGAHARSAQARTQAKRDKR